MLLRWQLAAHRQISRWVVAGVPYADPLRAPKSLHIYSNTTGYDGQFYWRLAVAPTHLVMSSYDGVHFDKIYRLNRIFYPVLAWIIGLGNISLINWSLIVVNLISIFILAQLGIREATKRNLSSWWGLSVLLAPGIVGALSRDLSEIVSVTLLVAGLLLARDGKWLWSGLSLAGATLTRETLIVPVLTFGLVHLIRCLKERRVFQQRQLTWLIPAIAITTWQLVIYSSIHKFPLFAAGGSNLGLPFVGFLESVGGWFKIHSVHRIGEALIIVLQTISFVVIAVLSWRNRPKARTDELAIFFVSTLMVICESHDGWNWPFDMRYGVNTMVIGWFFLLESSSRRTKRQALLITIPTIAATVLLRVLVI